MTSRSNRKRKHYDVLGVEPGASNVEIKRAFHRKAKELHPDVAGDGSRDQFQDVQRAYALLMNPARRSRYDETGHDGGAGDIDTQAMGIIQQALDALVEQIISSKDDLSKIDVMGLLCAQLADNIQRVRVDEAKFRRRAEILQAAGKRFRAKRGENILRRSIVFKADEARKVVAMAGDAIEVLLKARELLDNYEFSFERDEPVFPTFTNFVARGE